MRLRLTLLVVASMLISAPLHAQQADNHAAAEEQFQKGRDAMKRNDFRAALDLFRAAQKLEPGRGKLLNIALCEEQLGLYSSAFKHFLDVQAQLPAGDDRAPIVKQHLEAVGRRVPHLRIDIAPDSPPGTTVSLDGEPLPEASIGTELPIDPGNHVVTAVAPGAAERPYDIAVGEGGRVQVSASPRPVVAPLASPPPPAQDTPPPRRSSLGLGVAGASAGGALLVIGVGTGAGAIAKHASIAEHCPAAQCPKTQQPDIDTYHRLGAVSTATFILGGALAATGVAFLVISGRENKRTAGAWVEPAAGLGMVGARGAF